MKSKQSFLSKIISLMLTLAIVMTMTTASFANEIEKENVSLEELSEQTTSINEEDLEVEEQLDSKEESEQVKENENLKIKEEVEETELRENEEIKESRYNTDIPSNRIAYVYGTGGAEFYPNQKISREEAYISFLRTAEILETGKKPSKYPIGQVLQELEQRGVYLEGNRKTDLKGKITRAEIADMVDQYLNLEGPAEKTAVDKVIDYSFMSKDKKGNFNGEKSLSRAEMVTVLNRMQNRKADKASASSLPQIYKDLPKSHWAHAEILEATIAHVVDLNTAEQKWTSHSFTDNDHKKIKATEEYNSLIKPLIDHGIKNPTNKQRQAIGKMNQYISGNTRVSQDFNNGKNLVFAFEGAGDFNNKWSKTAYHNEGRYGAMYIVVKNKEIVYITTNGSTLPDNPSKTIRVNGVYKNVRTLDSQRENISNYISGNHKNYPGMRPYNLLASRENTRQNVKSLQGRASDGTVMNIHSGRSDEGTMSDGCLTIRDTDYIAFSKAVGYMPNYIGNDRNNFSSIQKIGKGKFVSNVHLTLVLDRTLMDENTKNQYWSK